MCMKVARGKNVMEPCCAYHIACRVAWQVHYFETWLETCKFNPRDWRGTPSNVMAGVSLPTPLLALCGKCRGLRQHKLFAPIRQASAKMLVR